MPRKPNDPKGTLPDQDTEPPRVSPARDATSDHSEAEVERKEPLIRDWASF